jgi:UDP-glucose 4-epimerase
VGGYAGRKALITGGLGFIGSNLAVRLVELGAEVTVADGLIPSHGGNPFNLEPVKADVRVVELDLREPEGVDRLVQGQEVVFDIAGQVSHVDSMTDPLLDLDLNYRSRLVLLEACRRASPAARIVFTGSRQQYGRARSLPVREDHPQEPVDLNGIHKRAAEGAMRLYHDVYGLPTCVLRLTNTYGPRMQVQHPRQGVVAWFVRLALDGTEIELFGGGASLRDFNYVDDVVDALLLAGERDEAVGEVYNLGHPHPLSLREFTEVLVEVAGGGSVRTVPFPPDRASIDIGSIYSDFSKIRTQLGWEPRVGAREGLAQTVAYYREHRDRYW